VMLVATRAAADALFHKMKRRIADACRGALPPPPLKELG
jgi:hypothetical protein